MTATPPDKRRFTGIHLSTAVVLMLAASILLWLNIRTPAYAISEAHSESVTVYLIEGFGWPLRFPQTYIGNPHEIDDFIRTHAPWDRGEALILNLPINFCVLLVLAAGCESLIRHRKPQQ